MFDVAQLYHARHTVYVRVEPVELAVCQLMTPVVHIVYVGCTVSVFYCQLPESCHVYSVGVCSGAFFVCCRVGVRGIDFVSFEIVWEPCVWVCGSGCYGVMSSIFPLWPPV